MSALPPTSRHEVSVATERDLSAIYRWLRSAGENSGKGFLGNRRWIDEGLACGGVTVVRDGRRAIAFLLAREHPVILCVKRSHSKQGVGRALFEAFLDRARNRDAIADMVVECVPRTSFGFWQKMGFERDSPEPAFRLFARRLFPDSRVLPDGATVVRVTVEFSTPHPEGGSKVLRTEHVEASVEADGSLLLGSTVIGPRRELWSVDGDRVRIGIDGNDVVDTVLRRDAAQRLGFTLRRDVACLDRIRLPA